MNMDDFWRSLGLNPNSSKDEVKKTYKALVRKYHPDNQDTGNSEKFREVHHAYKMLTDSSYSYNEHVMEEPTIIKTAVTIRQAVFGTKIIHNITKLNHTDNPERAIETSNAKHKIVDVTQEIPPNTLMFPFHSKVRRVDLGTKNVDIVFYYVLVDDPYYKVVNGDAILVEIQIEAIQALQGDYVDVQTLFGIKKLKIPAGTVPGDIFGIDDHGHLKPLLVRIADIRYPRQSEMKGNSKYAGLDITWDEEIKKDINEQANLDDLFNKLGGKPKP